MLKKNILSIDTSTEFLKLGLYYKNNIFKKTKMHFRENSENIIHYINEILYEKKISLKEINFISCVCGPGNFTSTKIGICIAKTLSFSLNVPIIKLSALDILAEGSFRINNKSKNIISIIEAYSELIYWSTYYKKNNLIYINKNLDLSYQYSIFDFLNEKSGYWIYSGSLNINYIKKILKDNTLLKFSGIKYQSIEDTINFTIKLININKLNKIKDINPIYVNK